MGEKMKRILLVFFMIMDILIIEGCRRENLEEKENISLETSTEESDMERITIEDNSEIVWEELETEKPIADEVETEDCMGDRLESVAIDKFGLLDEKIKKCIQENVVLKEGTELENISWCCLAH